MLSRMISARNARTLKNTKPVPQPIRALAIDLSTYEKRPAPRMARLHFESVLAAPVPAGDALPQLLVELFFFLPGVDSTSRLSAIECVEP